MGQDPTTLEIVEMQTTARDRPEGTGGRLTSTVSSLDFFWQTPHQRRCDGFEKQSGFANVYRELLPSVRDSTGESTRVLNGNF